MLNLVGGSGPLDARIVFVGEAPGAEEERTGKPFVGASGELLTNIIHGLGLSREEVYITNVVKERPAQNNIELFLKFDRGKILATAKYNEYEKLLYEELSKTSANIYVAIGGVALYALARQDKITKRRGSILKGCQIGNKKVIPIIHPASALRNYLFTHFIRFDLRRVMEESAFPEVRLPARSLKIEPNFLESMAYIHSCFDATKIGFDIEVVNEEISCISIARSPYDCISIPFVMEGRDYFTIDQEIEIWKAIAELLENPNIIKVGHNVCFDSTFIFIKLGIRSVNLKDTMVSSSICYPDFPKGLDFVTSICTREPYYKDDGKKWFKFGGSIRDFWVYNAKDSAVCTEAEDVLRAEAQRQGNEEAVARQLSIIPSLVYMQARGIQADKKGMDAAAEDNRKKIETLQEELNSLCGYAINPNSSKQLQDYFYIRKGIKPYVSRSTGNISCDEMALKRIGRKGFKEAQLILQMRHLIKINSTYLEMELDDDNRIRCSFNPVGTENGRLSSSKTIFGKGGNMQNLPPEMLRFLRADPGCVLYNIDLSQAENRIVAYISPEPNMISAFERGIDIHKQTAGLVFNKKPEDISDEEGSSSIGGGLFSERFWGKKCLIGYTEVLTPIGWVALSTFNPNTSTIMQWDKEGNMSFVKCTEFSRALYTGKLYTIFNDLSHQTVTAEHRIPYISRSSGAVKDIKAKDFTTTLNRWYMPLGGEYHTADRFSLLSKEEIRLLVAAQADGSIQPSGTIKFGLTKERKRESLRALIQSLDIEATENGGYFSLHKGSPAVDKIVHFLSHGTRKIFGDYLFICGYEELRTFIKELWTWDGYSKKRLYFTVEEENATMVQTIAHLAGYRASITVSFPKGFGKRPLFCVSFADMPRTTFRNMQVVEQEVENEKVYCPTVPSGYFLIRSNGRISVTGNSNHSLNYDLGYRAFALVCEIKESEAKYIVERYHSVYPGVRQYHAWIRAQLNKDRTITNCLGRRRLFTSRWGDELFKEAYAFIPQSTVADIINARGLAYVMNNPQFSGVEILNQVHDSLVVQISYETVPVQHHAECLKLLVNSLQTPISFRGQTFSIPADTHVGLTLNKKKLKGVKVNGTTVDELAGLLSTLHSEIRATAAI
ncbi:MAG: DNA polymerase [Gallionella sp.]|jgi:uracil-DNA glycosylase family 4